MTSICTPSLAVARTAPAFDRQWNTWSASLGALIWAACVAAAAGGGWQLGAAECLFLLAPLVTIPLGLRLAFDAQGQGIGLYRLALLVQPAGALLAAGSFAFPVGRVAGALAVVWLGVTGCIGLCGVMGMLRGGLPWFERVCLNLGLVYLPFGGLWLAASRFGLSPAGFHEPIVFLTAVHFHYAAFASPLLAAITGLAGRTAAGARHKLFPAAAIGVMVSPALLAAGWAVGSPLLKIAAALALAAGLLGVVGLSFLAIPHFRSPLAGALLVVSGFAVAAGMYLVCAYAGGEYFGIKLITIPQMTVTHGVLNSLGFTLCGLLAWRIENIERSK